MSVCFSVSAGTEATLKGPVIPHSLEDSEAAQAREECGTKTSGRRLSPGEGGRLGARVNFPSGPEHHQRQGTVLGSSPWEELKSFLFWSLARGKSLVKEGEA
jgi:hypothetical protein